MLLFIAVVQQVTHPCVTPPNGNTTGTCQSWDSPISSNLEDQKQPVSVSPLSLTQYISEGTCPLHGTSSVDAVHSVSVHEAVANPVGQWNEWVGNYVTGSLSGTVALCHVILNSSSISKAGVHHLPFQQMSQWPSRAKTYRPSTGPAICKQTMGTSHCTTLSVTLPFWSQGWLKPHTGACDVEPE